MLATHPDHPLNETIPFFFPAYDSAGASVTISGLAVTDIEAYKGTSMTQRASDNGYALLDTDGIDIDGRTGIHGFSIDTSDNTDAGFWAAGQTYHIVVDAITVDSQTVRFIFVFRMVAAEGVAGVPKVDATHWGSTAVGSAFVRANVLQIDSSDAPVTTLVGMLDTFASTNTMPSNLLQINNEYLTEGATGRLAAAFSTQYNVATPVFTNAISVATSTELAKVPKSDSNVTWNATAAAQIQSEAADALTAYDPPTNAEMEARTLVAANYATAAAQTAIQGATFDTATDSLEALRNRGDAAWATATGFSTHSASDVWAVGTRVLTAGTNIQLPANGLDLILVESGISAGAGLTNDTGTQLTSINARQALALNTSVLVGVLAGATGTNITMKQAGKPAGNTRVDATVTADGNRTALTLKVPD
jgi:hypothetical protein